MKKKYKKCQKRAISIFWLYVICDLMVNYMEISRFCRVTLYFFTAIHLERHWKCPWKLRKCPCKVLEKCLNFFSGICTHHGIVLQIQTAPSRLQPASARCFLTAMILRSAPSGIRAHAQHVTLSLPAGLPFQNIGVQSRPQRKICDCNQKADT